MKVVQFIHTILNSNSRIVPTEFPTLNSRSFLKGFKLQLDLITFKDFSTLGIAVTL